MDHDTPEGEEVEALTEAERVTDPLWQVRIKNVVDGRAFAGRVVGIDEGVQTKERLYLVQYEDGDLEHMTGASVRACQERIASPAAKVTSRRSASGAGISSPRKSAIEGTPARSRGRPKKMAPPSEDPEAQEQEAEEEDEEEEPKLRAMRSSGGARAMKAARASPAMKVKKPLKAKPMKAEKKAMKASKVMKVVKVKAMKAAPKAMKATPKAKTAKAKPKAKAMKAVMKKRKGKKR